MNDDDIGLVQNLDQMRAPCLQGADVIQSGAAMALITCRDVMNLHWRVVPIRTSDRPG
jgi:hypothetical protein